MKHWNKIPTPIYLIISAKDVYSQPTESNPKIHLNFCVLFAPPPPPFSHGAEGHNEIVHWKVLLWKLSFGNKKRTINNFLTQ